jgi:cell division septation protein DedD
MEALMLRFAPAPRGWLVGPVILVAIAAGPAAAQTFTSAIGVTGGWSTAGDLTPGMGFETVLEDGWTAGLQAELWDAESALGLRLSTSLAARNLTDGTGAFLVGAADLAVLYRLLHAGHDRIAAPFIAIGAGPIVFAARDDAEPIGRGGYGGDPVLRWMLAPAVGLDLFTRARAGLRLEVTDQIVFPSLGESPEALGLPRTHNPGVRATLQLRFGGAPRVIARPPAPAPARPATAGARPDDAAPGAPAETVYTLRLGPYARSAVADDAVRRLEGAGLPVWVTETEVRARAVVTLRVGALDAMEDARELAARLRRDFGYAATVEPMPAGQRVDPEAIVSTLRFLGGR